MPSDTIKKGNVVKTSPEAGTMIKKKSSCAIVY
ncbi:MAG: PASTA domain-containing protein [Enterococcus raffinosus]